VKRTVESGVRSAWRWGWPRARRAAALLAMCAVVLQLCFALRIALMNYVDPQSTSFQRSEIWRMLTQQHHLAWHQQWVDGTHISAHLKRAVIASEDTGFTEHSGVEWDALERAWERNQKAATQADHINQRREQRAAKQQAQAQSQAQARAPSATAAQKNVPSVKLRAPVEAKVIGGSTITQQLAKNLFLSGERDLPRKAQEFLITFMLEALLDKQRILEIYLNSVEWGEGVFGAEAAAAHYFHRPAAQLSATAAARLAVMLPAPKRFEQRPDSPYLAIRAAKIASRMDEVDLP
jgi:monofunctional glycosyltransferase